MMKTIEYEGVSFNAVSIGESIRNGLTEKDFVDRKMKERSYSKFKDPDRRKLLKEVYRLIKQVTIPVKPG